MQQKFTMPRSLSTLLDALEEEMQRYEDARAAHQSNVLAAKEHDDSGTALRRTITVDALQGGMAKTPAADAYKTDERWRVHLIKDVYLTTAKLETEERLAYSRNRIAVLHDATLILTALSEQ